jgi:KDO2-lipid IV(A) lauroyltransferase
MIKWVFRFFAFLPLRLNHALGELIGVGIYVFGGRSKRITVRNIQVCFPELSSKKQKNLVKKSLIEMGKGLSETGFIWLKSFEKNAQSVVKINGLKYLDTTQKTLLLVPHFGCWELTGRVLSLHKKMTFLYKPLKSATQESFLFKYRQQGHLSMASADKKGIIKLQRALNRGEVVGILPDQYPEQGGVDSVFFNTPVHSMALFAKLACKKEAQVLLTYAVRLSHGAGFELNLTPVKVCSGLNLADNVAKIDKVIEDLIRQNPTQYLWSYKRFKNKLDY